MDPGQGADLAGISTQTRELMRELKLQHGLRGGGLSEYRRVLEAEARDGDDPGRASAPGPAPSAMWRPAGRTGSIPHEPAHVAEAVGQLGPHPHRHHLGRPRRPRRMAARRISPRPSRRIRAAAPATTIEVLTPDFLRKPGAVETVVAARPDVYNHNLETVPRLYRERSPGRALFRTRCGFWPRSRRSTRPCSPSRA